MDNTQKEPVLTPMLFPYEPDIFWQKVREIIREEMKHLQPDKSAEHLHDTPGMIYKPLYKIDEVCEIFRITRPTIYDWIKHHKLKPYKIRSRVFFLWQDIQKLISPQD